MIEIEDFLITVQNILHREISPDKNEGQYQAITYDPDKSLFIVAGPGSGKTTTMVLKVLKLIFVNNVAPSSIFVTTFTKKAAAELISRILGWGDQLKENFLVNPKYTLNYEIIASIDFNQILCGTLDSLSEQILREYRNPGNPKPIVIEEFVATTFMLKDGLLSSGLYDNEDLKNYLKSISGLVGNQPLNVVDRAKVLIEIKERFAHDMIDTDLYQEKETEPGVQCVCDAIHLYQEKLETNLMYDYSKIETDFYESLKNGNFSELEKTIRFILVDEYQDTNLLQENIYFELAKIAIKNDGSIMVVGDDDQSIYRFRGATVDLFTECQSRIHDSLLIDLQKIHLSKNYRSSENIVSFINDFIKNDDSFQQVRVESKPNVEFAKLESYIDYPVLGMFRDDLETLSRDLGDFIHAIVHGDGFYFTDNGNDYHISLHTEGSAADICLLCSSPQEFSSGNKPRLPNLLRMNLENVDPEKKGVIRVYNPRGQNLQDCQLVGTLCGLVLECIDPDLDLQNGLKISGDSKECMNRWRAISRQYITTNTYNVGNISLADYVHAWKSRTPLPNNSGRWEKNVALIDLVYHLVAWIQPMQDDIEGLVYLEVILRVIKNSEFTSGFGGNLIFSSQDKELENASIKEAIRSIFDPIATGMVDINDELLETLPKNRLPIMSIHQAKGLEFPMVIVDVGSDFKTAHHTQEFKRYPKKGGKSHIFEDKLRPYSPLKTPERTERDRAFDDLIRQYFVAFSRPQDVLLLVGLTSSKNGYLTSKRKERVIKNVGTGWDRNGRWHWERGLPNITHI